MALRNLGMLGQFALELYGGADWWCKIFIMQTPPLSYVDDIILRDRSVTPACEFYDATLHAKPYSRTGLRHGAADSFGRGTICEHILEYLRIHRPRVVILKTSQD